MILVFGSINVDLVVQTDHLPCPGETVICDSYVTKPGGKGANQAVAAARAGGDAHMYGVVGGDQFGDFCVDNLHKQGVAVHAVERCERPTGTAFIAVDRSGENLITVACGANAQATAHLVPDAALGQGATTVLMQMEVPAEENWTLIERACAVGATSILNLAPAGQIPEKALHALDYLVVNQGEAEAVAGLLGQDAGADPVDLALAINRPTETAVIITLGGAGAVAAEHGRVWRVGALPIEVVDTTGAGDAFCGNLAVELDAGGDLARALHRAAVGAALACTRLGAQESSPTGAEVSARLRDLPPPVVVRTPD